MVTIIIFVTNHFVSYQGTMVGLLTADPTPKKPKKQSTNKSGRRSKEPVKKLFKSSKTLFGFSKEMVAEWDTESLAGSQEEQEEVGNGDQDGAGSMEDGRHDDKADLKLPTDYQFLPR